MQVASIHTQSKALTRCTSEALEQRLETISASSEIATWIRTIIGFGLICTATLAGEIGTLDRFGSEASLALYTGMTRLDNSSGNTSVPEHPTGQYPRQNSNADISSPSHQQRMRVESLLRQEGCSGKDSQPGGARARTSSHPRDLVDDHPSARLRLQELDYLNKSLANPRGMFRALLFCEERNAPALTATSARAATARRGDLGYGVTLERKSYGVNASTSTMRL